MKRPLAAPSRIFHSSLLVVSLFGFAYAAQAQYSENFERFANRNDYTVFGYAFSATDVSTVSPLSGSRSLRVGALSNPSGNYTFRTGYLNFTGGTSTISFTHRASNNSSSPEVRVQLIDMANNVVASSNSISVQPGSARTSTVNFSGFTGWYRLQWRWTGNGGSSAVFLDDISSNLSAADATGSSTLLADIEASSQIAVRSTNGIDSLEFKFTFLNNGPDLARNGEASIRMPASIPLEWISVSNGSFDPITRQFSFSSLAVGETAVLTIRSRRTNNGSFQVSTDFERFLFQTDPVASNNTGRSSYFGGSALPLRLLRFVALQEAGATILNWTTADEERGSYFQVEKSVDGGAFAPVCRVEGRGTGGQQTYRVPVAPGVATYRLKTVDHKGAIQYSGLVVVSNENTNSRLSVYPNPITANSTVSVSTARATEASLLLLNAAGAVISRSEERLVAGGNNLSLSAFSTLRPGVYYLRVSVEGAVHTIRLVKP